MGIPSNMTNKQLRLLVRIEKLLFEKKGCPFEEVLKQAKSKRYPNNQSSDITTMTLGNRLLSINKDTVNSVILGAGTCIH